MKDFNIILMFRFLLDASRYVAALSEEQRCRLYMLVAWGIPNIAYDGYVLRRAKP